MFVLELLPHCRTVYSLPDAIYRYRQAEDEKSAYYRLQKIADLAEYIQPIADGIGRLQIPCAEAITEKIYEMLLRQKLCYASPSKIRDIIKGHNQSKYKSINVGSPLGIYFSNRKTQLRHMLAIAVKSSSLYRKHNTGIYK